MGFVIRRQGLYLIPCSPVLTTCCLLLRFRKGKSHDRRGAKLFWPGVPDPDEVLKSLGGNFASWKARAWPRGATGRARRCKTQRGPAYVPIGERSLGLGYKVPFVLRRAALN